LAKVGRGCEAKFAVRGRRVAAGREALLTEVAVRFKETLGHEKVDLYRQPCTCAMLFPLVPPEMLIRVLRYAIGPIPFETGNEPCLLKKGH
jgi:hypothetical protein